MNSTSEARQEPTAQEVDEVLEIMRNFSKAELEEFVSSMLKLLERGYLVELYPVNRDGRVTNCLEITRGSERALVASEDVSLCVHEALGMLRRVLASSSN